MRELMVLRHAKSSWKNPGADDHDRPLNRRGERDAPRLGRWLRDEDLVPDAIVSSTAVRARTTAHAVAAACGYAGAVHVAPQLYLAGPDKYVAAARSLGGPAIRLLIVGHNPGVEELVLGLTGCEERMPTAALARIRLEIRGWDELRLDSPGRLIDVWRPKER
jgi:phosphohistidine phosphatase